MRRLYVPRTDYSHSLLKKCRTDRPTGTVLMGQPKGTEVNCDIIPKNLRNSKKIKYLCIQLLLNNTQYHTYLMLVLFTIMLIFMTATFTT